MGTNSDRGVWVRHDGIRIISDENDTVWCILESYDGEQYYTGRGDTVADALRRCARHVDTQSPDSSV